MSFPPAPRSPLIPRAPSSTVSVSTESATGVSGSSLPSSLHAASLRDSQSVSQHQGTWVVPDQGDGGTKMKMKAKAKAGAGVKTQAEGETIGISREDPVQTFPAPSSGDGAVGGTDGELHGVEALVESLAIASSSSTSASPSTPTQEPTPPTPTPPVHPFAHTTAKLELLPSSSSRTKHGIDVEEEARLYAAFDADDAYGYKEDGYDGDDGAYEEATDDVRVFLSLVARCRCAD
ncbi:hypothetical protein NLJ89_g478 [Agrocybe chaxingu]|uniref:Uncharacterized protein n=1 Tax=Agrocybe chaxingu TaxID=84603 RepID=A0A9W8TGF6_9AGAR|nr:hypothetical protein NLJ89_g478 [Agrocybe chaxingu]